CSVGRRQMDYRSAVRSASREGSACESGVGGADLQHRRSVAKSNQSVLDVTAAGNPENSGAGSDRFHADAVCSELRAGLFPDVVLCADVYLRSTGIALKIKSEKRKCRKVTLRGFENSALRRWWTRRCPACSQRREFRIPRLATASCERCERR